MFCSQCGVKASGKFCHACGSPLYSPDLQPRTDAESVLSIHRPEPVSAIDWAQDARYEQIMQVDVVRAAIAENAAQAKKGLSGEELLRLYDKFMKPPVSMEKLAEVVQPLYESWGIQTGKQRTEIIPVPIGLAIARTLCSFARQGQLFKKAEQGEFGCILTAELPSSVCALKGRILARLSRRDHHTQVEATTVIPGQMYDWGKSNRSLQHLFEDLNSDLGLGERRSTRRAA